MRHKFKGAIMAAIMFCMSYGVTHAEPMKLVYDGTAHTYDLPPISLSINNTPVQTTIMPPIQLGERVLVPTREVFEPMGLAVEWRASENKVYVYDQTSLLVLEVNGAEAFVNGEMKPLDMPPKIINEKLMIPIRFISEQLGFKVNWQGDIRSISIEKPLPTPTEELPDPDENTVSEPQPMPDFENSLSHVVYQYETSTLILDKPAGLSAGNILVTDLYRDRKLIIDLQGNYSQFFNGGSLTGRQGKIKNAAIDNTNGTKLVIDTFTVSAVNLYEQDNKIHIQFVKPSEKYEKIVVLDAGHGGEDSGTVGGGIKEKDINLVFTTDIYNLFINDPNIKVYMTRETDFKPSLADRVALANEVGADLFICMHNNSINKPEINGTETFYFASSVQGQYFAKLVQAGIVQNLNMTDRKAKADTGYYVLKNTKMPAALIEVGFLSSEIDRQKLTQPDFSPRLADIIYNATLTYFENYQSLN
ncbi:MAG: hypothetical protein K0S71_1842 [Clostridia bacterium]|jgi:N-acetylmuramoyl-L-alanine amidase|nr:hypothetical protein [Clostridia bacterium]